MPWPVPRRITEAADKPASGSSGGGAKGSKGAMSAAAVRRQSVLDHHHHHPHHSGGPGATAVPAGHAHSSSSRPAYIMTSAHSRRVSASNFAASAVSRAYENTYKTEPERPFSTAATKRVIREVMEGMLENKTYDTEQCKQLTTTIADVIKKRVKELGFPRYKLVTHVVIGQADDSSVAFASRCIWNASFDSFAEYTYKNGSLFAVGLVYGLYSD